MKIEVVKNAKRNIAFGMINKIIVLLCPFVERIAIRSILGAEYLGLGSLFTAIISVLGLTELGFSSAMVYHMYKPVAENDTKKLNTLLNYYRKVYRFIGIGIIVLGLLVIPFLPYLIKGSYPADTNITILYLFYLGNTALSYFLFAYMSSLVIVHQRDDVNSRINTIVKIGLTVTQIIALVFTHNYYLFVGIMLVFTLLNNLLIAWRVKTLYPKYKPKGNISTQERVGIRKVVTGTFIQQLCVVTRNSLDSICVSAFLGLILTGIYNNYYIILNGITSFAAMITASFMGGIGNHVATKNVEDNFEEMKKLDFAYLWLGGWCMTCMLCLYQPFMEMWMGKDMMLPFSAVILFCLYFYLLKLGDVRSIYSSANGLWWAERYRSIAETIMNLVLNITLGYFFGVHGIIVATIISLLICNYIWSVGITFKNYFKGIKRKEYYIYQGRQTLVNFLVAAVTYLACQVIPANGLLLQLILRGVTCLILPNILFVLFFYRTKQFKEVKTMLTN